MTAEEMIQVCQNEFEDICVKKNREGTYLLYRPKPLKRGHFVLSIADRDDETDTVSHLNREGVYRLKIGVRQATFERLFGRPLPKAPKLNCPIDMGYDYARLDTLTPHPFFGWMGAVSILSPSAETFETKLRPLIRESYLLARERAWDGLIRSSFDKAYAVWAAKNAADPAWAEANPLTFQVRKTGGWFEIDTNMEDNA